MFHSHLDERKARVGRTQRDLDGYRVAVCRGNGIGRAGILRIDTDEAAPLRNADEPRRILANADASRVAALVLWLNLIASIAIIGRYLLFPTGAAIDMVRMYMDANYFGCARV